MIYIPIIHTKIDMGALNESIRRSTLHKMGQAALKRKMNMIEKTWSKIEKFIDELELPFERVRLYQDGLPVCGRETEIVKELANAGSRNHRLLFRSMERGATIMGTESAELLVEEYELVKKILSPEDTLEARKIGAHQKALSNLLLRKRDQYIADRINYTLQICETGILFLGMLHSLENLLDEDIRVVYPIN